jgi:hypothetical protein
LGRLVVGKRELCLGSLLGLLGQKNSLDVGEDSTLGDGDSSEQFVQLLVVTDGQLKVTGDDPGLLVVTGSISSQLEDLSCQVLHDGGHVDWGTSSHTLSIVSLAEQTVDTSNGELKSSTAGPALCLSLNLSSFAASRHDDVCWLVALNKTDSAAGWPSFYPLRPARAGPSGQQQSDVREKTVGRIGLSPPVGVTGHHAQSG